MSIAKSAFGQLQKIGKSLMLPVSVLPIAGILLGVGAAKFSWLPSVVSNIMESAGGAVFSNMGLLFAIGVALGFTKNDGVSALAAAVGYFIMIKTLAVVAPETDVGILGGILAGSIAAWSFNRFFKLELPAYLGFFAGKRSVPIITGFGCIALGVVLSWIWPPIGHAIETFSLWAAYQNPELAFTLYGVVERLLIPLGLHHIWNAPFFFQAGSCVNAAGEALNGVLTCYLSADSATRIAGNGFGQLAGGYLVKMFGLPAAALAIWHSAKPENRAKVGGVMISAAFTSFLTGITEPIEFAFLFVAPILYVIHALLAGSAFFVMNLFNVVHGTSFSHGFIDYVVLFSKSQNALLIPVFGVLYAVIYYSVFRTVISLFNLKTPGREDDNESVITTAPVVGDSRIDGIITAFGGAENITSLDNCITRLRIDVADIERVQADTLKALGATDVLTMGNSVQAIFGLEADTLRTKMAEAMTQKPTLATSTHQPNADKTNRHEQPNNALLTQEEKQTASNPLVPAVEKSVLADADSTLSSAKELVSLLGGKANIQGVLTCSTNRLRLELKQRVDLDVNQMKALGVKHIMPVNDNVVHLLMSGEASRTEQAMKKALL
ncbi:PTS glucose transporter subunit IIBC [Reinekea thalattae]|uniref:PTS glucose transporter subunit IIBC n=1 Tax=Reinekea thalattae TaxID=2593301 RepID=A0A5C8Z474_9GAMM|nr:PTS glucose transporter subunit IIBC [Reinekea thalattae]TXR52023.1 PTS glucose transporter subunit IIBC [Reinekea thalattae]